MALNNTALQVTVTITDGDGDKVSSSADVGSQVKFEDDGPSVTTGVSTSTGLNAFAVNMDETTGADRYNTGESESAPANVNDNTGSAVSDPTGTTPFGSYTTAVSGGLGGLFTLSSNAGSDGQKSLSQSLSFVLTGAVGGKIATTLDVTQPAAGGNPDSNTGDATAFTPYADPSIYLVQVSAGVLEGRVDDGQGGYDVALRITITNASDPANAQIKIEQFMAIDHGGSENPSLYDEVTSLLTGSSGQSVQLQYSATITDGDNDTATDTTTIDFITSTNSPITIDDDAAVIDVTATGSTSLSSFNINLDETTAASDRYNTGESESAPANVNDNTAFTAPDRTGTNPIGSYTTSVAGGLGGLFSMTVDNGTDGESSVTRALSFATVDGNGGTLLTNLDVTQPTAGGNPDTDGNAGNGLTPYSDPSIYLVKVSDTVIEGRVANGAGYDVALRITITNASDPANAQLKIEQFMAIDHGGSEGPSIYDEVANLLTATSGEMVQLKLTATVTDGDGDVASDSATVNLITSTSSPISIDDDGPLAANDTDSIAGGSYAPATGNVITDASAGDEGDSDTGADSSGTDGAKITGIKSENVPANTDTSVDGSGNFVVDGQYGTLTINQDGSYSYVRSLSSPGGVQDQFTYTLTDGDGDTTTATLTISIGNATPTGQNSTGTVDDEGLRNGILGGTDDAATTKSWVSGTLTSTGGDGAKTYSFANLNGTSGTLGTESVNYSWDAANSTLSIVSARGTVAQVYVNPTTGAYTFALLLPVLHAVQVGENDALLNLNFLVTDADGSTDTSGQLQMTIDDDTPQNFSPEKMLFVNTGTATGSGLLNIFGNTGADTQAVSATFVDNITNASNYLTKADGTTLITSGGQNIVVTGFGTSTITGTTTGGQVVFTATLNPSGTSAGADSYTITFFKALDDGSGVTINNFGAIAAGNSVFTTLNPDGTTQDILASAYKKNADGSFNSYATVNTNSSGIGVANQSMNDGEVLRIDFVNSATAGSTGSVNYYDFAAVNGHYNINDFSFTIIQKGGGLPADSLELWVRAYDADNDNPSNTTGSVEANHQTELRDDPQVAITSITVNGIALDLSTLVTDRFGGYLITGLDKDDVIMVSSNVIGDPTPGFSRLEIENVQVSGTSDLNGDSFDIGVFAYQKVNVGSSFDFNFLVQARDGDGDTATGTITVTSQPSGTTVTGTASGEALAGTTGTDTLNGNGGDDWLAGSAGADTLNGGSGNDTADYRNSSAGVTVNLDDLVAETGGHAEGDTLNSIENVIGSVHGDVLTGDVNSNVLIGLLGNDTLNGGGGNDILIGGAGLNTLNGGAGADRLVIDPSALSEIGLTDVIQGYSGVGGDGDVIDLTQLFEVTPVDSDLGNYVQVSGSNLQVDVDGQSGPSGWVTVATFDSTPTAGSVNILYHDSTDNTDKTGQV
ncbi:beta strand repeat-containing protein [Aestuariivirga sp.]|uniref:beta strand repeat-containing protein n=1 Tax=Aestuariivirga sp. TaxID=2650926 RepID=UPI00391D55D1